MYHRSCCSWKPICLAFIGNGQSCPSILKTGFSCGSDATDRRPTRDEGLPNETFSLWRILQEKYVGLMTVRISVRIALARVFLQEVPIDNDDSFRDGWIPKITRKTTVKNLSRCSIIHCDSCDDDRLTKIQNATAKIKRILSFGRGSDESTCNHTTTCIEFDIRSGNQTKYSNQRTTTANNRFKSILWFKSNERSKNFHLLQLRFSQTNLPKSIDIQSISIQ